MRDQVGFGVPALDDALGGLIPGDNVVWVSGREPTYAALEEAFLARSAEHRPTLSVAVTRGELGREVPDGVEVLSAVPGSRLARAGVLADELERWLRAREPAGVVIDGLAALAKRWGLDEATAFFARTCPMMLELGTVTYWRTPRSLGSAALERMRQVTQCMLELRGGELRVLKAEGRPVSLHGSTHLIEHDAGTFSVMADPTAGRLARGLAAVRHDLGLTQAQLATAAGVTASAVSQAESGARGLSLDTLLVLSDRLGVSLDRLVSGSRRPGYLLARHDRSRFVASPGVIAIADDAAVGLRAYLVTLGAEESGGPPVDHAGSQLVAVTRGLVQVGVDGDTPVLRAGDSVVTTNTAVRSWTNLSRESAVLVWVLRD